MTKKDYELIASVINREVEAVRLNKKLSAKKVLDSMVVTFAWKLGQDNSRFDETRFEHACYLGK